MLCLFESFISVVLDLGYRKMLLFTAFNDNFISQIITINWSDENA